MKAKQKDLVIITGASSGIGAATAKLFSAQGHPLLLVARRVERLRALNLPNTLCAQVDITDALSFSQAVEMAQKEFGAPGCLINNAGVMLLGQLDQQDPLEWQRMFDVNVMALLGSMKAILPEMKKNSQGSIINVSSIAGRKTFPNHAAYCGTKFAVHAISENLRQEVAEHGIRVCTIAPGAVETELLSHTTSSSIKEGYSDWKEQMGGALAPEDVAQAILYAYQQPKNVCIRELVIAATGQRE